MSEAARKMQPDWELPNTSGLITVAPASGSSGFTEIPWLGKDYFFVSTPLSRGVQSAVEVTVMTTTGQMLTAHGEWPAMATDPPASDRAARTRRIMDRAQSIRAAVADGQPLYSPEGVAEALEIYDELTPLRKEANEVALGDD